VIGDALGFAVVGVFSLLAIGTTPVLRNVRRNSLAQ
jgi:hypothetical protein